MKLGHDEIRAMLPEYVRGSLSLSGSAKGDIEKHLEGCHECREELSLLAGLLAVEVPDPGDLFWKTLPQRMREAAKEQKAGRFSVKALFFGAFPVAAATAVLLLILLTVTKKQEVPEVEISFRSPFTAELLDYVDLTEGDVTAIIANVAGEEEEDFTQVAFVEDPLSREISPLSAEELDSVYEELKRQQRQGG